MPAIRFRCPNGHALQVRSELAGQRGKCPECGCAVQVPSASKPGDSGATGPQPSAPVAQAADQGAAKASPRPVARPVAKPIARPEATPAESVSAPPPVPAVAGPPPLPESADTAAWYLRGADGKQYGPVESSVFATWIADGRVRPESYLWREGWPEWKPATDAWGELPAALPSENGPPADKSSAIDRYSRRKRQNSATQAVAAGVLLVLTLSLGGVLAAVLLNQNAPVADAPPAADAGMIADQVEDEPPAEDESNEDEPNEDERIDDDPLMNDPMEDDPFAEPAMEF
ncbi:MAG: DUF4339 domain-containing protein [Planctomycetota bacterium]